MGRAFSGLAPLKEPLGGDQGASETGRDFWVSAWWVRLQRPSGSGQACTRIAAGGGNDSGKEDDDEAKQREVAGGEWVRPGLGPLLPSRH